MMTLTSARAGARAERDEGFSLVELAVYVAVLSIIATVVAATMLSLFRSETTVSELTSSANDAQIASTLLRDDVRNARDLRVTPDGTTLTASVATPDAEVDWVCVVWRVAPSSDGVTLTRSERPDAAGATPGAPLTLLSPVSQVTRAGVTAPYFARDASGGAIVSYAWRVATSDNGSIDITSEVRSRAFGDAATAGSQCFA